VVPKAGRKPSEDETKRFALANAPAYAHPRFVSFVEELPLASAKQGRPRGDAPTSGAAGGARPALILSGNHRSRNGPSLRGMHLSRTAVPLDRTLFCSTIAQGLASWHV
jgi:hypothetical protein